MKVYGAFFDDYEGSFLSHVFTTEAEAQRYCDVMIARSHKENDEFHARAPELRRLYDDRYTVEELEVYASADAALAADEARRSAP